MTDLIPSAGTRRYDVLVIGAGIVGLATAEAIQRVRPDLSMAILEKEVDVGLHQTGRNSGVIHAGLYYEPGSLKAALSVAGGPRLFEFCEANNIPTTQTGKVVVATDRAQVPRLDELERRARANGVDIRRMGSAELSEREPHARGVDALWVPFTGAVDFGTVAAVLADQLRAGGAEILTRFRVRQATRVGTDWVLSGSRSPISGRVVINCAGLHVDRVARLFGVDPGLRILPFRGEYYSLNSEAANLIHGHLYPVPDPHFPHLGVHFTRSVTGGCGGGSERGLGLGERGLLANLRSTSRRGRDAQLPRLLDVGPTALACRHC